jgi:1,4-dihydroxy-2-naphthoate octaprenyltransferase
VIIKEGKEKRGAVIATLFMVIGLVLLLTPIRDSTTRHGIPVWIIGTIAVVTGLVFLGGVFQNLLRRRRR